jgi:hypothetical protein
MRAGFYYTLLPAMLNSLMQFRRIDGNGHGQRQSERDADKSNYTATSLRCSHFYPVWRANPGFHVEIVGFLPHLTQITCSGFIPFSPHRHFVSRYCSAPLKNATLPCADLS